MLLETVNCYIMEYCKYDSSAHGDNSLTSLPGLVLFAVSPVLFTQSIGNWLVSIAADSTENNSLLREYDDNYFVKILNLIQLPCLISYPDKITK